jgi:hypothetical protein
MAAEVEAANAPSLAQPVKVVATARTAFARDRLYRKLVFVNLAFIAVILVMNYLLELPRALEPYAAVLIYFPLAIGQWRFWRWGGLDVKTAMLFVHAHRRAYKDSDHLEKMEKPDVLRGEHFRVALAAPNTLGRAAGRAFYVYTIALTLGVIFSTLFLPLSLGAQVSRSEFAIRSTAVAFLTLSGAFTVAWILPPLWLIEDAGVRYFSRKAQSVESVARWYLVQLGPILGMGAIGTFFLIYWVAGFTLVEAVLGLVQLSLSLYPASLTATFLYQKFRAADALAEVRKQLDREKVVEHGSVLTALLRTAPK